MIIFTIVLIVNKVFCHLNKHQFFDCNLINGKKYEFYFVINGYNEFNLLIASTISNNYYQITRVNYYLSDKETKKEIKFFSDSI